MLGLLGGSDDGEIEGRKHVRRAKEAGASDESARAAATDISNYDDRMTRVEGKLDLLQWMLGANIGLTILIIGRTFSS